LTLVSELPGPFLEFLLSADDRRAASLSICGFMREAEFLQAGRFFAKKPSVHLMLRYRLDRCWVALFSEGSAIVISSFLEPSFGP